MQKRLQKNMDHCEHTDKKAAIFTAAFLFNNLSSNYAFHQRSANLPPSDDQLPATLSPCATDLPIA